MKNNRKNNQKITVEAMIKIYCSKKHNTKGELCNQCSDLLDYALTRIDRCKFGDKKPNCSNCKIHCYKKDMRQKIIEVMRYSGPRMLIYHPIMAIQHLIDKFKFRN